MPMGPVFLAISTMKSTSTLTRVIHSQLLLKEVNITSYYLSPVTKRMQIAYIQPSVLLDLKCCFKRTPSQHLHSKYKMVFLNLGATHIK